MTKMYMRGGVYFGTAEDMIDRIEELEASLQDARRVGAEWFEQSKQNHKRATTAEAKLAKAVEALEWQADAIHNSITVNMKHNHRILLDGIYHEGPLVDWVHKILTGFEAINRNTLAELTGGKDD